MGTQHTPSARELAAAQFSEGDRVQSPDGRQGKVAAVNVYGAAIVDVQLDGDISLSPWLFYTLTNLSRS